MAHSAMVKTGRLPFRPNLQRLHDHMVPLRPYGLELGVVRASRLRFSGEAMAWREQSSFHCLWRSPTCLLDTRPPALVSRPPRFRPQTLGCEPFCKCKETTVCTNTFATSVEDGYKSHQHLCWRLYSLCIDYFSMSMAYSVWRLHPERDRTSFCSCAPDPEILRHAVHRSACKM